MPARSTHPARSRPLARLRLACICLGITLLVFSQSSGLPTPDTKLDLVVDPLRFLGRALSMWDARAASGQMQDQAYGYLFPMGPFFALAHGAALPAWVTQRAWESLLLVAAFLGTVRLARLLRVPGFWPRVAAGLAYALAPRMLMELPVISSELLPVVVLPWLLIPLVAGSRRGSPRRAAARSGVALLFASGINASATVAVLPVPALWLLTRRGGPRRRALAGWWAGAVVLACLWWIGPLLILGRYSPPFLDWIESSTVTTSPTNLLDVLRGVDHWQAYLGPSTWPAGWILAAAPSAIVATSLVAALGLAGLARRATPERTFLLATLALGLVLLTLGHVATVGPPFAGTMRTLLDGPLNAFRNVHKFDPLVRLPIAVGVGHAVAALAVRWPQRITVRPARTTVAGRFVLVLGLAALAAVAIAPAINGRLAPATRTSNDPGWWERTGNWLGAHAGRALVVPGAAQPSYLWGAPRDDALQPYADGPWAVRDAAPAGQPGYVRLLDSVEAMLASGGDQPTLAPVLARAGVRYLVVRNDLDATRSGATQLRFVHATIASSPGWRQVASFGPALNLGDDPNRLLDLGLSSVHAAVDVYENPAWAGLVGLLPLSSAVLANGSSDELPALVAAGLPAGSAVVFGRAPAALGRADRHLASITTDGIRRREFGFGGSRNYSPTLTASDHFSVPRAAHDYLPPDAGPLTTAVYSGIRTVRASSSAGRPTSFLYRGAAYSPWAAVDGDRTTSWFSAGRHGGVGQWIELDLAARTSARTVQLAFAADQTVYPTRVRVTTDAGSRVTDVSPSPARQTLALPEGPTGRVRITVLSMSADSRFAQVGVATFAVAGVRPGRSLVVPGPVASDVLVFQVAAGRRNACLSVAGAAACDPSWALAGEEDAQLSRRFRLAAAGSYVVSARIRLQPGARLSQLLDAGNPLRAIASSVQSSDPRERPGAAVDGDPTTGWVAKVTDRAPTLAVSLPARVTVSGLRISTASRAPVRYPTRVLVHAGSQDFTLDVPADGELRFPAAVRTSSLRVSVLASVPRTSRDTVTGVETALPVGIGELTLLGPAPPAGRTPATVSIPCSAGLHVTLNGFPVALQVSAPVADVLSGQPVTATACRPTVSLPSGEQQLTLTADAIAAPESVTLRRADVPDPLTRPVPAAGVADVQRWGDTDRTVRVSTAAPALLVVRENASAGWQATLNGARLPAVTVDGWEQAWLVPAGADGVVHLRFVPQTAADWSLAGGLLAALILLAGAGWRTRRREGPDPARPWTAGPSLLAGFGVVVLTLIGGVVGALLGVAVALTWPRMRAVRGVARAVLPGAVLVLAGAIEALGPVGSTHVFAGDATLQVLALVAVGLAIAAPAVGGAPRPREAAQQRPLEQVPGQRRRRGGRQRREQVQRDEVALEHAPTHPARDADQ